MSRSIPVQTVSYADDEHAGLLYAQLMMNASVVRASVVGNLVNAVVCVLALKYYGAISTTLVMLFAGVITLLAFWRMIVARKIIRKPSADASLPLFKKIVVIQGATLGSCWGYMIYVILSAGIDDLLLLGGVIGAGMMSAGAIAYRTIREASYLYVIGCATGSALGLLTMNETAGYACLALLLCYMVVLFTNIRATSQGFDASYWRQHELQESKETIQLLLNDFTEQGSEWLIEVDGHGCILNPCARLQEATGKSAAELAGCKFGDLIDAGPELDFLRSEFLKKRGVRRHIISLHVNGEKRWWSITARPVKHGKARYRGLITDITAQRSAEERVSFLAHYDGLTKLPNRFLFTETIASALEQHQGRVSVMYIDLDHFKNVNDTLGHPVGDQVLKQAAERIEKVLGDVDVASRLGGDEFAVLVTGARVHQAGLIADQIVKALSIPVSVDHHDVIVGASVGIATGPTHGTTAEELLRRADLALYAAKAQGRGRAMHFEKNMDEAAQARRSIETDLRGALERGELCLHYQPLVDAKNQTVTGFEALIRWQHPVHGLVMPNRFIPIAEETGLIVAIGEWVLRQGLADAARWPDHASLSINLSPAQMRSPTLLTTLVQALAHSGVALQRLCLEITESVLLQDSDVNMEILHRIRSLGVQISLDDFGTGYSSLNYLRRFPFDRIKIDRCFVSEIEQRDDCQAIVRSVIALADSLGMKTIAEGVEREEQAAMLRREGCMELQGFLYSKAIPAQQLENYLASGNQVADAA